MFIKSKLILYIYKYMNFSVQNVCIRYLLYFVLGFHPNITFLQSYHFKEASENPLKE